MATRILHVVGKMNQGGIGTWLMHVLRAIDRKRFKMDFMVHTQESCAFDDEIRARGSVIISCPKPSSPWRYANHFRDILRMHGPFTVVHSHVYYLSGLVLKVASREGISLRIAHAHTDRTKVPSEMTIYRRFYREVMRRWIDRYATMGIGVSEPASAAFFGPHWQLDPRWRTVHPGVDLKPFYCPIKRSAIRKELGIADDAFVLAHVGNFFPAKNHIFLVRVAEKLAEMVPELRLLLIGEGPLRGEIMSEAAGRGIAEKLVLTGARGDVPRLLLGAADACVFPSKYEGLGIAVVEAQAAGLPTVISDRVPQEAIVVPDLVRQLPLESPVSQWAQACVAACFDEPRVLKHEALAMVECSNFQIDYCVKVLESIYQSAGAAIE